MRTNPPGRRARRPWVTPEPLEDRDLPSGVTLPAGLLPTVAEVARGLGSSAAGLVEHAPALPTAGKLLAVATPSGAIAPPMGPAVAVATGTLRDLGTTSSAVVGSVPRAVAEVATRASLAVAATAPGVHEAGEAIGPDGVGIDLGSSVTGPLAMPAGGPVFSAGVAVNSPPSVGSPLVARGERLGGDAMSPVANAFEPTAAEPAIGAENVGVTRRDAEDRPVLDAPGRLPVASPEPSMAADHPVLAGEPVAPAFVAGSVAGDLAGLELAVRRFLERIGEEGISAESPASFALDAIAAAAALFAYRAVLRRRREGVSGRLAALPRHFYEPARS